MANSNTRKKDFLQLSTSTSIRKYEKTLKWETPQFNQKIRKAKSEGKY